MSMKPELSRRPSPRLSWLPALMLLWSLLPGRASAAELRSGDMVRVGPEEVIEEDLYAFGNKVSIQGTVLGDLVTAGQTVEILGEVRGDVMSAAANTRVAGPVRGSLRVMSGELVVSGDVGEDAILSAGDLHLTERARVGKDLYLAAGNALVQAPVQDELRATAGTLTLAAPVGGDVRAEAGTLSITPEATVGGDLLYRSEQTARIAEGAMVSGKMEQLPAREREWGWTWGKGPFFTVYFWVRSLIGLFALGLLLVLVSPNFARRAPATLRGEPWLSLGWGAVLFFGLPLVAGIFFLLGLLLGGWWLGLFILALYAIAIALCFPVVGLFIGRWLLERFGKAGPHVALALLVGLVLLTLVGLVPVLGSLVVFATILFGLGALLLTAVRGRRPAAAPV